MRGANLYAETVEAARSSFNARKMAVLVAQQSVAVSHAAVNVAKQNLDDTIVRAPFAGPSSLAQPLPSQWATSK